MRYVLVIGERAYSSWSLRGWLMFAAFGLPVEVVVAPLYTDSFTATLAEFPPARLVPALRIEEEGRPPRVIWETLAIAETLSERHPDRGFWPADPDLRALARSLAAEMHAGFTALRGDCPMNLRRAYAGFAPSEAVRSDLGRLAAIWALARKASGATGPWLFGDYCLADVFFAPVATRIATYGLPVGPEAAAYVAAHLAHPALLEWRAAALADPRVLPNYDKVLPDTTWPGPA